MERMDGLAGIDGARRGDHRLRNHLSAEDALAAGLGEGGVSEFVGLVRGFEIEEVDDMPDEPLAIDAGVDFARMVSASLHLFGSESSHDLARPLAIPAKAVAILPLDGGGSETCQLAGWLQRRGCGSGLKQTVRGRTITPIQLRLAAKAARLHILPPSRGKGKTTAFRRRYLKRSTCSKSSSTGVARPKIGTDTLTRAFSKSSSSTSPLKLAKGPSSTLTWSPIS